MKKYTENEITKVERKLDSIVCDKCGENEDDIMELQEWIYIHFTGGYNSIFGDGYEYEADFCQKCTKELVGQYLRMIAFDFQ